MFGKLRQLDYQRSAEEALGFYLAYTLGLLIVVPVIGVFLSTSGLLGRTHAEHVALGGVIGSFIYLLYCTVLAIRVMLAKNMKTWHSAVLVLLVMVASIVHGVVGMIVVAYMTTRPRDWLMPEKKAPRAPQRRKDTSPQQPQPTPQDTSDETSEIVRQHEEAMARAGRKISSRARPDVMEDVDTTMQGPERE